jgi:hypothetical protein
MAIVALGVPRARLGVVFCRNRLISALVCTIARKRTFWQHVAPILITLVVDAVPGGASYAISLIDLPLVAPGLLPVGFDPAPDAAPTTCCILRRIPFAD